MLVIASVYKDFLPMWSGKKSFLPMWSEGSDWFSLDSMFSRVSRINVDIIASGLLLPD